MATVINPFVAVDGNGHVRANARLYFYLTGTTTPQDTYADASLSSVNTNPVVADSNGLFPAIYLGDPPTFSAYKAILKTSADVTVWTTDPIAGAPIAAPLSATMLRGYLAGLQRTASTTTTMTISDGVCVDDTRAVVLTLPAGTVNCATVGADGMDAGALGVSTSYHVFAIGKTDGTVARLVSASATSPTMPSGYVYKRRIRSFKTNASSQIIADVQNGDEFILTSAQTQWSAVIIPITTTLVTLVAVPAGVKMNALMRVRFSTTTTGSLFIQTPDETSILPADAGGVDFIANSNANASGNLNRRTDTSGQVKWVASVSNAVGYGAIYGWIDRRGRDD